MLPYFAIFCHTFPHVTENLDIGNSQYHLSWIAVLSIIDIEGEGGGERCEHHHHHHYDRHQRHIQHQHPDYPQDSWTD